MWVTCVKRPRESGSSRYSTIMTFGYLTKPVLWGSKCRRRVGSKRKWKGNIDGTINHKNGRRWWQILKEKSVGYEKSLEKRGSFWLMYIVCIRIIVKICWLCIWKRKEIFHLWTKVSLSRSLHSPSLQAEKNTLYFASKLLSDNNKCMRSCYLSLVETQGWLRTQETLQTDRE